ncbi:hypothetical protein HF521_018170 [Silurus meridionalis]|uniref:Ig-like domain-containing protein n=1 Tax=Silurus meridionalis TaxID=175797 RepID=A0A8T0BI78_SILME|nr:hypothetical protein HF521_018170 [Silurus meridionalis]
MSAFWIFVSSLCLISPVQSTDFSRLSFISVKSGDSISLNCPVIKSNSIDRVVWYKHVHGEMPKKIGERTAYKKILLSPESETAGITIAMTDNAISLTIPQIKSNDEGLYYCGILSWENFTLSNGTFLIVTGDEDVKVSVFQSSVSDSVPAGASVTLQCSVLSESRTAELQVLWFRAAPSQSHPQIIYTHHNSSLQCESESSTHTCVYNLSKNIFSLNDTGTYYCAVVLCGKIIFGNGSRVQLENDPEFAFSKSLVISLGTSLVMCWILISVQAVLLYKKKNCQQFRERMQHGSARNTEKTNIQDSDSVELNYAALHFNERKTKRVRKNRDSIYSEVKSFSIS